MLQEMVTLRIVFDKDLITIVKKTYMKMKEPKEKKNCKNREVITVTKFNVKYIMLNSYYTNINV